MNRYKFGEAASNYRGGKHTTHKPEGNSHRGMLNRCYSPTYRYYRRYGGRSIVVCGRWLGREGFKNFLDDMGEKPSSKHSLDRIDNDGNYCPENCKWSTQKEQVNNSTGKVRIVTINGKTHNLTEWSKLMGVNNRTISTRLREGWSEERAIMTPANKPGKHVTLAFHD